MLGKLIKHEWMASWKLPTAIICGILLTTIIGCISFETGFWRDMNNAQLTYIAFMAMCIFMLYVIILAAGSFAIVIYFAYRFYKSMFTDQGYLMHTLPVKPYQHIISKGLVALIWNILTGITITLSVFILLFSGIFAVEGSTTLWNELFVTGAVWDVISEVGFEFYRVTGINPVLMLLLFLYCMLSACIFGVLTIYMSAAIGQLSRKHKLGMSICAYFVIIFAVQIISTVFTIPYSIKMSLASTAHSAIESFSMMNGTYLITAIVTTLFAVGFFFVTNYLMSKKLNLE